MTPHHFLVPFVFHVPKFHLNLFYVNQLTDQNCTVFLAFSSCFGHDRHISATIGHSYRHDGLYYMNLLHLPSYFVTSAYVGIASSSCAKLWHCLLGYLS